MGTPCIAEPAELARSCRPQLCRAQPVFSFLSKVVVEHKLMSEQKMLARTNSRFQFLMRLFFSSPLSTVAALVFVAGAAVLNALQPYYFRPVLDAGSIPGARDLAPLAGELVGFTAFSAGQDYFRARFKSRVVRTLREQMSQAICRAKLSDVERFSKADVLARFDDDATKVGVALDDGVLGILGAVVLLGLAIAGMTAINPRLFALSATATGLALVAPLLGSRVVAHYSTRTQHANGRFLTDVHHALEGLPLLKAYGAEHAEAEELMASVGRKYAADMRLVSIEALVRPAGSFVVQLAMIASLAAAVYGVAAARLTLGSLIAFVMYLIMMLSPLGEIADCITSYKAGTGALQRVVELMTLPAEDASGVEDLKVGVSERGQALDGVLSLAEVGRGGVSTGGLAAVSGGGACGDLASGLIEREASGLSRARVSLELRDVTYSFEPSGESAAPFRLGPVTLSIPAGSRCAILGRSGSGKSTLIELIERFREPESGAILVNGVDCQEIPVRLYRRFFAYVDQNPRSTGRSVREELEMARPGLSREEAFERLEQVGLRHLVSRYDDRIGDGGAELSGGEQQRLAWCRALLSGARVFVLDEPTSSVDVVAAGVLSWLIAELSGEYSVIMVTHQIDFAKGFDQIALMDHGALVGRGSHSELMGSCSAYRELVEHQVRAS